MTEADLATIEQHLAISLPSAYRATVLGHPFPADSYGAEGMLLDSPEAIIDLNNANVALPGIGQPFFIGSDFGEEWYFLDAAAAGPEVFVYQLETGRHQVLDADLDAFLARVRRSRVADATDRAAERARRPGRHWWEFWK